MLKRTLLLGAWLVLAGCGGDSGGTTAPPATDKTPATLTVSPNSPQGLVSGATTTISATVLTKAGASLGSAGVAWSSSDPAVASVSGGVVTAARVGSAIITASIASLTATTTITVAPGPAAALGVRTQPVGAGSGSPLATQPIVEIRDAAGNLVTSSSALVTVTIASGGGTLSGRATVTASGGVASFDGLTITGTAGQRTFAFASSGLVSATSNPFNVTLPPGAYIAVDNPAVSLTTQRGTNPGTVRIAVTSGGTDPLAALTVDAPAYDPGQPTGWLTARLDAPTSPATLTLNVVVAGLVEGTYHATVTLTAPAALNSPQTISVTLTVTQSYFVTFGGPLERVRILDAGASYQPGSALTNNFGGPVNGVTVAYTSRSPTIASVGADGRVTARAGGDAWIVASTPLSSDSVFVIVPQNATGPIIRSNLSNYVTRIGDTAVVTVILDTRATPVGAAVVAVDDETPATSNFTVAAGPPTPIATLTSSGVIRVSVGTATGMTGTVTLLTLKLTSRTASSGYVYLYGLDLTDVNGASLTALTSSTRLPIVFR